MSRLSQSSLCLVLLAPSLLLAGCSADFGTISLSTPVQTSLSAIHGHVHGGQQPVVGAKIYVYAAGTSGYGGASALLSTTPAVTDVNGNFIITSDYTCTSGQQVYLYVTGGDSSGTGAGANPAIGLLAVLGTCPASGSFVQAVPNVEINEVSTIAAAYAMAPFATDATHVSSSGTAAALTGIANAFANAAKFYDITGASGQAALVLTPGSETTVSYPNEGYVPYDMVNTLADILADCVNTVPTTGANSTTILASTCTTLLNTATSDGTSTGTVPSDTATAAINIAHHPAANPDTLYTLMPTSPPFEPVISTPPTDFALFVMWYGQTINSYSGGLAIDASGSAWIAGSPGTVITSGGNFVTGHTGYAFQQGTIALDTIGDVWIVNGGGVSEFSTSTGAQKYTFSRTAPPFYPDGGAIDGSNTLWVTESVYQNNTYPDHETIDTFTSIGGMGSSSYINTTLQHPGGLAFDGSGNKWIIESNGVAEVSGAAVTFNSIGSGTVASPNSLALDHAGDVWITEPGSNSVVELSSGGSLLNSISASQLTSPESIAVDGLGQVWVANYSGSSLTELSNSGAVLSGGYGYNGGSYLYDIPFEAPIIFGGLNYPTSLAIDGSGDVWAFTEGDNFYGGAYWGVAEFIGIAAPVITPMAAAVAANAVGSRP